MHAKFWSEIVEGDIGVYERNTIGVKEVRREVVNWIHMDQDRVYWKALVNMVLSLQVP
jgi:hypothetical protein